jgi:glycosyltransferase involved in cell wall biosynthesis
MKVGILGTRGVPNAYGGFEQFAQYLSNGLAEKGHAVFVYNSSDHPYQEPQWGKVNIIHCKDWEGKIGTAGQFIYDYNCIRDARKRNFDILLQLGYTSNSIWHRLWPKQSTNIVNMDGLEWKRSKYNKPTQRFLQMAEKWAARNADLLIADSVGIQDYLAVKYQKSSVFIPYGAEIPGSYSTATVHDHNLKPGEYFLLIARMEPENNVETIIVGYLQSGQPYPLLIVGNPKNKFGEYLTQKYNHPQVRFIGAVYNKNIIDNLRHYSGIYFHGHSVGGTNPSLLEAMACECNIAAHDNTFNKAILNEDAWYFSNPAEISQIITTQSDTFVLQQRRKKNIEKIQTKYSWNRIIEDYERVFIQALQQKL